MKARVLVMSLTLVSLVSVSACGDDDSTDKPSDAPKAGSAAVGGGGKGGAGGAKPASGGSTSSSTTPTDMMSVACGSTTCQAAAGPIPGFATACCADESTSTCGMSVMGNPCSKPVQGDMRCPPVDIMGFIMLPSCCTPDDKCGIDASMFGMGGCVDLKSAADQAASMGGGMGFTIMFPSPRSCSGGGGDAGAADAGN
jgi:hypothetical protein